jgi:hypothetical protein
MARCGCAGSTCNCVVTAGVGTTVTGAGTPSNPYVISADSFALDVADTATVDMSIVGDGTPGNPFIISGSVICAGLVAQCGIVSVDVADTDSVNLTASGGDPNVITADVIPDNARAVTIGPAGVGVCLSTDAGNTLTFGTDGCLFGAGGGAVTCDQVVACITVTDTPTVNLTQTVGDIQADVIIDPAATNLLSATANGLLVDLTTGCGLTGDGTPASPLVPQTDGAWPFLCDETNGTALFCDADGNLRTACPPTEVAMGTGGPANNVVNIPLSGAFTDLDTGVGVSLQNPSDCANAVFQGFTEIDVEADMPAGSSITIRYAGDDYQRVLNTTATNWFDFHIQFNRGINANIPPGGTLTSVSNIQALEGGTGGVVVNRVQWRSLVSAVAGCN